MVVNTVLVFSFVALWHDLTFRLLAWGWLVSLFIIPELCAKYLLPASKVCKPNGPPGLSLMLISVSVPESLVVVASSPIFPRGLFRLLTSRVYVMRIVRTMVMVQTRLCSWGRTQHYDDDGCQFGRVCRWYRGGFVLRFAAFWDV